MLLAFFGGVKNPGPAIGAAPRPVALNFLKYAANLRYSRGAVAGPPAPVNRGPASGSKQAGPDIPFGRVKGLDLILYAGRPSIQR